MASEIQIGYTSGKTIDSVLRNAVGQVWQTTTFTFVTYASASRSTYLISATEQGTSGIYAANMPVVPAGSYSVASYVRTTPATAAETDQLIAGGIVEWDGTKLASIASRQVAGAYASPLVLVPTVSPTFLDSFIGATGAVIQGDSADFGGTFVKNPGSANDLYFVSGGGASATTTSSQWYTDNRIRPSSDYTVRVGTVLPSQPVSIYLALRQESASNTGYLVGYDDNANAWTIYKNLSVVKTVTAEAVPSGTLDLRVTIKTVTGGARVTLWANGRVVISYLDNSPITAANFGGFYLFSRYTGNYARLTNYAAYDSVTPYGDGLTSTTTKTGVRLDLDTPIVGDGVVDVYRSVRFDFTPSTSTLIASGASFPYEDVTGIQGVSYVYRVQTRDGTGFISNLTIGGLAGVTGGPYGTLGVRLAPQPVYAAEWGLNNDINLVAIGDSVTAGATLSDPSTQALPIIAASRLATRSGKLVSVSNAGVSGSDTTSWLPNTYNYNTAINAANSLQSANPGRLLVFPIRLGVNDSALSGNPNGNKSKAQYKTNIRSIVDALLAAYPTCRILLLDPTAYTPNAATAYIYGESGLELVRQYIDALVELTNEYAITQPGRVAGDFNSFAYTTAHPENYTIETGSKGEYRIHPNAAGAAALGTLLAIAIWNAFGVSSSAKPGDAMSLTSAERTATATAVRTNLDANKLGVKLSAGDVTGPIPASGNWAIAGTAMTLTPETVNTLSSAIQAGIISEDDGQQVLAAIINKINATTVNIAGLSVTAIVNGVLQSLLSGQTTPGSVGKFLADLSNGVTKLSTNLVSINNDTTAVSGLSDLGNDYFTTGKLPAVLDADTISAIRSGLANQSDIVSVNDGLQAIVSQLLAGVALTPDERNAVSAVIESHLLNDGDGQMLVNAIVGAIGNQNIDQTVLIAAIRADLERTNGMLASKLSSSAFATAFSTLKNFDPATTPVSVVTESVNTIRLGLALQATLLAAKSGTDLVVSQLPDSGKMIASRDDVQSSGGGVGTGDIYVDHNYKGTDNLRAVINQVGQDNVIIRAYVKADMQAGIIDPEPPVTVTGNDGRFVAGLQLSPNTYILNYDNPATKRITARELVVDA